MQPALAFTPMPPQAMHDEPALPMHVPSNSPAHDAIVRLLALLKTLAHEFDDTDWFDERLFRQRVDPLLEEAEATLQHIRRLDPTYPYRPLHRTLHAYMMRRLQGLSAT